AEIEGLKSLLVVGSHLRHEAPMLAHRVRKAALAGTAVAFVNPARYEYLFPVVNQHVAGGGSLVTELCALARAAAEATGQALPAAVAGVAAGVTVTDAHRATAAALAGEGTRLVLLGALAIRHPFYADLRAAAVALATLTGARVGFLPEGGNAVGAALAGALPHRDAGGQAAAPAGLDARRMLEAPLAAYVLFGGIELEFDTLVPAAMQSIKDSDFVVAITPYASEATRAQADVLLPMGTFTESSGTYVNVEGRWQSFAGAVKPLGEARPGWKVLRVLGNLLGLPGFDFSSSDEVRDTVAAAASGVAQGGTYLGSRVVSTLADGGATDLAMYRLDAVLRRAPALQKTRDGLATAGVS
ncbi:MAG: molybdopterin-dependent oxidoreductase, partial [Steroidobacteraceae bacterium]|nr:molybdopterin-dependent oxidoreductase [Steroidobacteraceae bacterium]